MADSHTDAVVETLELRLRSEPAALEKARIAMVDFVARREASSLLVYRLERILEELVTNFFLYAYPLGRREDLWISLHLGSDEIEIVLDDGGIAFDPLREWRKTSTASSMPGDAGRGIMLARRAADRWTYEYIRGRNRSTIGIDLSREGSSVGNHG